MKVEMTCEAAWALRWLAWIGCYWLVWLGLAWPDYIRLYKDDRYLLGRVPPPPPQLAPAEPHEAGGVQLVGPLKLRKGAK